MSGNLLTAGTPDSALLKETARLEREFPMQPIQASQFEDLFEQRLHLYDSDLELLAQERNEQDQIAEKVREANHAFNKARMGDSSTKERERALQELENGYLKYKEIISNIEVGRKFYNDLAKIVGRFRDECKVVVHQRRMEASQMEAYAYPFHDRSGRLANRQQNEQRDLQYLRYGNP